MNEKQKKAYVKYAERRAQKSPVGKNCVCAFFFGGLICAIAQGFFELYTSLGMIDTTVKSLVTVTMIFLTALLTGIGIFDNIARVAGAGTLVPITGFANAVVAPAIDNKAEGLVLGLGAKIFIIAGPVILYGTLTSAVYGVILWCVRMFM